MDFGHCFISYSNRDAEDFGPKLAYELEGGYPYIDTWFDKRDIKPGRNWDDEVPDAIKNCKCLLFVLTEDSSLENSICTDEWDLALRYKKPIILLRLQADTDVPFRLRRRQNIDISKNFKAGMARLRQAIARIDSPEGILDSLKDRLVDADRDLQNATSEINARVQSEFDNLKAQITRQEEIIKNPKGVVRSTDLAIARGIDQVRKEENVIVIHGGTKVINADEIFVPPYFQGRFDETKQIADFLKNDTQCVLTVVGRAGIGKTVLTSRLLKYLERGKLPDSLGDFQVDGIVYLREAGSRDISFSSLYNALVKFLLPEKAGEAEMAFKEPKSSTESKMKILLNLFSEGLYIVLLDNFDELVDTETQNIKDTELDSALRALLAHAGKTLKIIITTRNSPHQLNLYQPGRQQIKHLDEGLPSPHAENLLRELDSDGRLGLKTASDELLNKARELTNGYPRALEALYGILASDRYADFAELLNMPLPKDVVEALIGEAFSRLDTTSQRVMQALAVYNRPIPPVAIDYLLQKLISGIYSTPILDHLVSMHFARREAGRYYLHPSDQKFAFDLIPDSIKSARKNTDLNVAKYWNRKFLFQKAGDYFLQIRKPVTEWKSLEDLNANLFEYEFRMAAEEYDKAAQAINDATESEYLNRWGYSRLIIDLQEPLIGKLKDAINIARHKISLGNAYYSLGFIKQAITQFEEIPNIPGAASRSNALALTFGSLANCYGELGNYHLAIKYLNKALPLTRKISDRRGESTTLVSLGTANYSLGEAGKAIEFFEQSLVIARRIGDRSTEAIDLENIGYAFLALEDYQKAKENYHQAIQIGDEISFPMAQLNANWGLAQAYLFQNDLPNARATIEAALQYDVPSDNHHASTLHGIIVLRQGERKPAQEAFTKAIAQTGEILAKTPEYYSALDAKGLALSGLTICDFGLTIEGREELLAEAVETFRKAREIAPHAGVVKSVLRLFDELVKCDEEGVLKGVREVIEGS